MPCRVPKRRFSCGAPQHLTKNLFFVASKKKKFLAVILLLRAGPSRRDQYNAN